MLGLIWRLGHHSEPGMPPFCRACRRCSCGHRRYCPVYLAGYFSRKETE